MPCMRRTLSCFSLECKTRWAGLFSSYCTLASTMCVCAYMRASVLFLMSLVYIWDSHHVLGARACFFISLCLLFASVGQASARTIASLPWTLFTSLLTHRLVLLCIGAHCFIFWDLPGDGLAAPESALGLDRCLYFSLSLSLQAGVAVIGPHCIQACHAAQTWLSPAHS